MKTTLRITAAAHLGRGLGRVDGKVFMVPLIAVGDTVEIETTADHGSWAEAVAVQVVEPGPGRVEPRCPVFGTCGGCALQHLDEQRQAEWKTAVFKDVLRRIGKIEPPEITYVSGAMWNWRCRVAMHAEGAGPGRDAGFFERSSHRVVPPGRCPIAVPEVAAVLEDLRSAAIECDDGFDVEIEPVSGADGRCIVVLNHSGTADGRLFDAVSKVPGIHGVMSRDRRGKWRNKGDSTIAWPTAGLPGTVETIRIDPRGFTQAHIAMNPNLVETVIGHIGADPAGLKVLELYAGAGNITLPLGLRGAAVLASDINGPAVATGAETCSARGLKVNHLAGSTEEILRRLPPDFRRPDVIVADPPRNGFEKASAAIAAIRAARVVICSCEPSALARDLKQFLQNGYSIDRITVVDMFPATYHMETVISLTFDRLYG